MKKIEDSYFTLFSFKLVCAEHSFCPFSYSESTEANCTGPLTRNDFINLSYNRGLLY